MTNKPYGPPTFEEYVLQELREIKAYLKDVEYDRFDKITTMVQQSYDAGVKHGMATAQHQPVNAQASYDALMSGLSITRVEPTEILKTPISVFFGRFQCPHRGHHFIAEYMKHNTPTAIPHLCIIDGKNTSQDKERNPLGSATRQDLLTKMLPGIDITIHNDPYTALETLLINHDVLAIYEGDDRDYSKIVEKLSPQTTIVKIPRHIENISATELRAMAREGDWIGFGRECPPNIELDDWSKIFEQIKSTY